MHSEYTKLAGTEVRFTVTAGEEDLKPYKQAALQKLAPQVKIAGFRQGKVPLNLVEKNVNQEQLATEFLDTAMSDLYAKAAAAKHVRPVTRPEVAVKKFVPFDTLEFEVKTHIIGEVKLPDYKKIKLTKQLPTVTAEDVSGVLKSLQTRLADKKEVKRGAKSGDQAWIDFKGVDAKGKAVNGADGKDYPLLLGSGTFIPGFEANVAGMKPGTEKTFTLTFPTDYGVKVLADKKVTFTATLKKVEEVSKSKLDDAFAAKAGPFKTIKDLKADIKKQLAIERQSEMDKEFQSQLVGKIVDKTTLAVPQPLIEQQAGHNEEEIRRNLSYRGQTWQEFLDSEGLSEEQYKETILQPQAERQVKTSIILGELAEAEQLSVSPEELEVRIRLLKGQYKDAQMQTELDKPANRREIASRMLTEKVLQKLEEHAGK